MIQDFDQIMFISLILILFALGVNIYWFAKKSKVSVLKKIIFTLVLTLGAIILPSYFYLTTDPHISKSIPENEGISADYNLPIQVFFNIPVDVNKLNETINPQIRGKWVWKPYLGISRLTKEGMYVPEETLFPGQRVVVYLTGIGRIGFHEEGHEGGFVFQSTKLPEIINTDPANNSKGIDQRQAIILTYDSTVHSISDVQYTFTPAIKFTVDRINDTNFKITPQEDLKFSTHYTLQVSITPQRIDLVTNQQIEHDNPVLIHQLDFDTKKEPTVDQFSPQGENIAPNTKIKMLFVDSMDRSSVEQNLVMSPQISGSFEWLNDKALIFTPDNTLPKDTPYTVTLKQGAKSQNGLTVEKDLVYNFRTLGKIVVTDFSPFNNQVKVDERAQIKVSFNQDVDHLSAQSEFSIDPAVAGDFSWDGNIMIYVLSENMTFNTKYTVKILPGIKSINGTDSVDEFDSTFSTRINEIVISMPIYYEPQVPVSFACNLYATMMALAWKGFNTNASQLIAEIGNDPTQNSSGQWMADPDKVYVGSADGFWGYGVYWDPIQKLFTNRGIKTELHQNWNLSSLAQAIQAGHPVEIWRYNGTSFDSNMTWGTPGVYAINGQHGGVVTGFRGTADNPTAFYINDPWFGLIWMNAGTFDYYWSRLNRVGLVVF